MSKKKKPNTSLMLDPIKIAFSQNSISFKFTNGTLLSTAITKLVRGTIKLSQFPPIRVFHINNTWYSLDNRRLYVFKEAAKKGVFTQVPVIDTPTTEIRRNEIDAKLTTMNAGRQVTVRGTVARTTATTKCHYCLKECQTAGHLFLHCQENHLEEYREESAATTQTIDQFLLGKDFLVKDDILVSLDHLKVETSSEKSVMQCGGALSQEFKSLALVKTRKSDVTQCKWEKTIELGAQDKENDSNVQRTKKPSGRDGTKTHRSRKDSTKDGSRKDTTKDVSRKDTTKDGRVESKTPQDAIKRGPIETVYWQSSDKLNAGEVHIINLFVKVLHFRDEKYPLC